MTIGLGAATLAAALVVLLVRGWDVALAIGSGGALVTFLLYGQQRRVASDMREAGQQRALELHRDELRRLGYRQFWAGSDQV